MNNKIDNLRERRKVFYSQQEFAELIGIDPCHLSRVEHGRGQFSASTAKLVEAILTMKEHPGEVKPVRRILFAKDRK